MATRVVNDVIAVATSPARLAGVMNLLHRGLLANPVGEERMNEILGRADCDVLTLTRDGGYVPDEDEACVIGVADGDASVLLSVVEELVDVAVGQLRIVLAADRMSEHERTVMWPFYEGAVASARAFVEDLGPLVASTDWAALVEVTIEDGGERVYFEQAVGSGSPLEAMCAAVRQRVGGRRLQDALSALDALGDVREATEVSCRLAAPIGDGRDRVTVMRVEVARVDADTLEMLDAAGLDDLTRRELFDSAERRPVGVRVEAPLLV